MATKTQAATEELKKIIGKAQGFPTLPVILTQILQVLNNPKSSSADIARLLRQDQAMTASLLKLVNSAAYGLGRRVVSVEEAITVLGFSTIMNLTVGAAVMDAFLIQAFDMKHFWRHTIATSIAAKFFAQRAGREYLAELAGTLGLVHDIGKLAFMTGIPRLYGQVVRTARATADISLYVEQELLGIDHCQAGVMLARRWGWPAIYQDVIASHHSPYRARLAPELNYFVYLGNLAAHIALDPEYQGATFAQVLELVRSQRELEALVSPVDWQAGLKAIEDSTGEMRAFIEVLA